VHLAGIDHDRIARLRFDLADTAPGTMRAVRHDPDAELIMRMARKGAIRGERHCFDARNGRPMLLHAMYAGDQSAHRPSRARLLRPPARWMSRLAPFHNGLDDARR